MSLLVATGLGKAYGALDVFQGVNLRIEAGDRIGFVGSNGAGKTTLLRILAGVEAPSTGAVHRKRRLTVGYLPQDPPQSGEATLREAMLDVFEKLQAQGALVAELAQELASAAKVHLDSPAEAAERYQELLEAYGQAQIEYEVAGGYTYEVRIAQVLGGLGFDEDQHDKQLAHLSGGERTRALLAQLLLQEPELLLLDEPTNHLDMEAVEWLEETLLRWRGALVVVAHDRYFLDKVATRMWDMESGRLETYRGNYSDYHRQRNARRARQLKEWEAQEEFIEKTEDFIRRNLAGQRTREAQGRRTRLERFLSDEAMERPNHERHIRLGLTTQIRSGDLVLATKDLQVGYDEPLFRCPDLEIRRGDRVALIGPNGAGKTTLLRTILGQVSPLRGKIRFGASVEVGYLAQAQAGLREEQSVLDAILDVSNLPLHQARSFLGQFLFSGDDVFRPISTLSGGQRSRVALARLTLQGANFLLLDEPTNHLDLASQEILEDVLRHFPGTILLVSHDRYLIQALATHVWRVAGDELRTYKGDYEEHLRQRATEVASSPQLTRDSAAAAAGSEVMGSEIVARPGFPGPCTTLAHVPPWPAAHGQDGRAGRAGRAGASAVDGSIAHGLPAEGAGSRVIGDRKRAREERKLRKAAERQAERTAAMESEIQMLEEMLSHLSRQLEIASLAGDVAKVHDLGLQYQVADAELNHALSLWAELA